MPTKSYIPKTFPWKFPHTKDIEALEKEIEKRLGTDIQITIANFPPDHSYFVDDFHFDRDTKKKFWPVLQFDYEEISKEEYLHTLLHCHRAAFGFPRFTAGTDDFGLYIDNCIDHCIIYEQMAMLGGFPLPEHLKSILELIKINTFEAISKQELLPIQKLQLAAVASEITYLHAFNPEGRNFADEFRKWFPEIDQIRKDLVKLITQKGIATPESKFAVIQFCWEKLGQPATENCTYSRFSPKNGVEIFPISAGYQKP
jgi:hypothetical protein